MIWHLPSAGRAKYAGPSGVRGSGCACADQLCFARAKSCIESDAETSVPKLRRELVFVNFKGLRPWAGSAGRSAGRAVSKHFEAPNL